MEFGLNTRSNQWELGDDSQVILILECPSEDDKKFWTEWARAHHMHGRSGAMA